jgi:drug/metabolite transporter (DMT)-like permease
LALAGAGIVLWPEQGLPDGAVFPFPRTLADWLGVLGGFSFALNNVMLRREAHRPEAARALAMFLGGCLVAAVLAVGLSLHGAAPWPPTPAPGWLAGAVAMGAMFLVGNLSLQYGASRLPANVTAVVMLTEVLFASLSAVRSAQVVLGGALIVGASMLATFERR